MYGQHSVRLASDLNDYKRAYLVYIKVNACDWKRGTIKLLIFLKIHIFINIDYSNYCIKWSSVKLYIKAIIFPLVLKSVKYIQAILESCILTYQWYQIYIRPWLGLRLHYHEEIKYSEALLSQTHPFGNFKYCPYFINVAK